MNRPDFAMTTGDEDDTQSYRTPLSLIIKTIVTHGFALACYTYTSNLLRRPMRNNIYVLRVLFFAFVPTLPLVELVGSAIRSLAQFIRNYEDDDEIHLWYYVCGALGVNATLSQSDDNKDAKAASNNLPLLQAGSHFVERTRYKLDVVWFGKLVAALFGLTQAVGTIVMYVRRLNHNDYYCLGFDHRNGGMGIASAICGGISIIVLLLRLDWKVSKSFEAPAVSRTPSPKTQFAAEAVLALLTHLGIACAFGGDNRFLYSSVGSIAWLFTKNLKVFLYAWQSILLLIFVLVFRKEIARRIGMNFPSVGKRIQTLFASRQFKRVQALVLFYLVMWAIVDIIWLFVTDIIKLVRESHHPDRDYWWQDPISDSIIVI
ncbi:uncharacterized protein BDZ99DRAFT_462386 [Mytilinidion resinicola]|uniref:Uncharacterized protein n=1 Tax=Mytilinidion resinicola TaxID=574789 RepID=A0A6A6YQS4_9PEZI|nr:uncharacterized protein BDZ99DRAFT_462386 [Mytilinidion resinicola]KAF2811111.1 hypothetical protein BDZ99DRAFT_462386 [Mytilinidion resinicola]